MITAHVVEPDQALPELAAEIARAKGDDPLAHVTVVVPTNTCGVMARRSLGARGGVVGVDMVTLNRLAELIAGPLLADEGRAPMSTPVVDLAVAAVLDEQPGIFRPVADHPSTVVALRELHTELRLADPDSSTALANRSRRAGESVRVSRAVTQRLADAWYDEADLLERASDQVGPAAAATLGPVVAHLPDGLSGRQLRFLRAVADHVPVSLIVAVTGVPEADTDATRLLAVLGLDPSPNRSPNQPPDPPTGEPSDNPTEQPSGRQPVRVVSTTDADDEVRIAVRHLVDAARRGVPLERMAVLWPAHRPYARLVEHHLGHAGIRWNGRPGTSTAERLAPRLLLDLLDVDRRGLRRRDLFALLADVPARDASGAYLPTAAWERVSREAGVARDDDWSRRLGALADDERWGDSATGLDEFVRDLRSTLGHPAEARRWWDWAEWCGEQLDRWLTRATIDRLPEPEYRAYEALMRALDRLRHLDPVGAPVNRHRFRATLAAELDASPGREGRVGDGVTVGSLAGAVGLDVDVAVVLGGAEGILPPTPDADPLLSDAEREDAGLATSDSRAQRLQRNLLALVATTEVTVTVPRGDLRATARHETSRWITGWADDPHLHVVESHTAGLAATEFPASASEHRLRTRYGHVLAGMPVDEAAGVDVDPVLTRGLQLRAGREHPGFTEFDGDLSAIGVPQLDTAVSPSRLESWVACPHGYFARYLLGVKPVDEPDDEISITALDRGSAHHTALDRFHHDVIDGRLPQPTDDGWLDIHRDTLVAHFHDVCTETERRGRTGRPAYWADERARMEADLVGWLSEDSRLAVERGVTVLASEHRFDPDSGVEITLADGRHVGLFGSVDRIDRARDGTLVVTDHKTGSTRKFKQLSDDDPTAGATLLQLPAYAAAARLLVGEPDARVRAEYGMMGKGKYERIGYDVTPEVWAQVQHDLAEIVGGIEAGFYPNRPERPGFRMFISCEYCEPDHLGTEERWREWERKRDDPRLARWFGPPPNDDEDSDAGGSGS